MVNIDSARGSLVSSPEHNFMHHNFFKRHLLVNRKAICKQTSQKWSLGSLVDTVFNTIDSLAFLVMVPSLDNPRLDPEMKAKQWRIILTWLSNESTNLDCNFQWFDDIFQCNLILKNFQIWFLACFYFFFNWVIAIVKWSSSKNFNIPNNFFYFLMYCLHTSYLV